MKYYRRIDINGDPERLPKEEDKYIVRNKKNGNIVRYYYYFNDNCKINWLEKVDWYLQPCEFPESGERKTAVPEISDEEIESMFPDTGEADRNCIIGAKWYKSEIKRRLNLK